MKYDLLLREVHQDSKGFFVFYGGYRYRPCKWFRHTEVTVGQKVMLSPYSYSRMLRRSFTFNHIGHVFIGERRETWTCGEKHKLVLPDWCPARRKWVPRKIPV